MEAETKGLSDEEASKMAWAAVKRAGYHKLGNGKWGKSMESTLTINDDNFTLEVPFVKVNAEKRIVAGFATLDNVDQADEVLDFNASQEAFKKWAGNVREMHEKKAVGKAIKIEEKTLTKDGVTYNGIWVEARISKGAEDTWQKVLDGTLSGFSVGGGIQEKQREMVKLGDTEKEVWRITKYRLGELSLVDAPCNALASVCLFKSLDGHVEIQDVVADEPIDVEKAYNAEGKFVDCSAEIGRVVKALESWRDKAIKMESDSTVSHVSSLLADIRSAYKYEEDQAEYERRSKALNKNEGEHMDELQNNKKDDNSIEDVFPEDQKSILRKLAEFLIGEKQTAPSVEQGLEKEVTSDMNEEEVKKVLDGALEEINKSVDTKFGEVGSSLTTISELLKSVATADSLEEVKKGVDTKVTELAARIEALETSGAVKKSNEGTGEKSEEKVEKGLWMDSMVPEFLRKKIEG